MKTYTIDQIKTAYWEIFHESGEVWFPYLGPAEENNSATEDAWEDFEEVLNDACKDKEGASCK